MANWSDTDDYASDQDHSYEQEVARMLDFNPKSVTDVHKLGLSAGWEGDNFKEHVESLALAFPGDSDEFTKIYQVFEYAYSDGVLLREQVVR